MQDLEGTKVGPAGGAAILRGVAGHSTLEAVDLSSTGLGSQVRGAHHPTCKQGPASCATGPPTPTAHRQAGASAFSASGQGVMEWSMGLPGVKAHAAGMLRCLGINLAQHLTA